MCEVFTKVINRRTYIANVSLGGHPTIPGERLQGQFLIKGYTAPADSLVWMTASPNPAYNFSGLDIALGNATCALPGDLNHDGVVDSIDIQLFTVCFINAAGGAPGVGCACADMASPSGTLDGADLSAFVSALLP